MSRSRSLSLSVSLLLALSIGPAAAGWVWAGEPALDPTFGSGGLAIVAGPECNPRDPYDPIDTAHAVFVRADGSIVVAGNGRCGDDDVAVAAFSADGTPLPGFGRAGSGYNLVDLGASDSYEDAALAPDGGVLVLADGYDADVLVRFTPEGRVDRTFGQFGRIVASRNLRLAQLAVEPDGRIVVSSSLESELGVQVDRFLPNGLPDRDFGDRGTVLFPVPIPGPVDMAIDGAGRIVLAGARIVDRFVPGKPRPRARSEPILARLLPDGSPDPQFGDRGGWMPYDLPVNRASPWSLVVAEDGRITVGGLLSRSVPLTFMLRVTDAGSVDTTFGDEGFALIDGAPEGLPTFPDVALDTRGRAILAETWRGHRGTSVEDRMMVIRVDANGVPDPSFGRHGVVLLDLGRSSEANAAIASGEAILVAGNRVKRYHVDMALVRLRGD